jgi:hypothetical protein
MASQNHNATLCKEAWEKKFTGASHAVNVLLHQ